jgi:hypothetical protein
LPTISTYVPDRTLGNLAFRGRCCPFEASTAGTMIGGHTSALRRQCATPISQQESGASLSLSPAHSKGSIVFAATELHQEHGSRQRG